MTLDEAAERAGQKVIYQPHPHAKTEEGVITSVNSRFVFVRYGADVTSKATDPTLLVPLAGDRR